MSTDQTRNRRIQRMERFGVKFMSSLSKEAEPLSGERTAQSLWLGVFAAHIQLAAKYTKIGEYHPQFRGPWKCKHILLPKISDT